MAHTISRRRRGSKEIWLNAAYDLLISGGIEAVKVMILARHLDQTRTSFYWYFKDIAELHDAMIARWEAQNTGQLVGRCEMHAETICEALFNLMDCWLDPSLFDSTLDLAIRNWARTDPALQKRLDAADAQRIEAVEAMFRRFGYTREQAEVRGLTVIYTQIGYISMRVTEDRRERLARVRHYVELFAGCVPDEVVVDAFCGRHEGGVLRA